MREDEAGASTSALATDQRADKRAFEDRPKREKTWDECGIEERLERLRNTQRDTIRYQGHTISSLRQRVSVLESHQHGPDGKLLIGIHDRSGNGELAGGSSYDPLA